MAHQSRGASRRRPSGYCASSIATRASTSSVVGGHSRTSAATSNAKASNNDPLTVKGVKTRFTHAAAR
jgi:hypothetical protein